MKVIAKAAIGSMIAITTVIAIGRQIYQPKPVIEYGKARRATAQIVSGTGRASAVFVSNTVAVTAKHVCLSMRERSAATYLIDYRGRPFQVTSFKMAPKSYTDLCMLVFKNKKAEQLETVELAKNKPSSVGSTVYLAGFPGGMVYTFRTGKTYMNSLDEIGSSNPAAPPHVFYLEWVSVPSAPGASGGPAFDEEGALVGIVSAVSPNFGTAIVPISELTEFFATVVNPELNNGLVGDAGQ